MKRSALRRKKIYGMCLLLAGMLLLGSCGEKTDISYEDGQQGSRETEEMSEVTESAKESENAEELESTEETEAPVSTEEDGESVSTEETEDSGSAEEAEASGTSESTETAANTGVPIITPIIRQDNRYAENGTLLAGGYFQSVEVSGEGFENVGESIREWFEQQENSFEETLDLYENYAKDVWEDSDYFSAYSTYVEYSHTRMDAHVISMKGFYRDYAGGAHGNYGSMGMTFDVQSGRQLSFWDLTEEKEIFSQQTLEYCLQQVAAEYSDGLFEDYADTIQAVWQEEPNWYLDAAGITVIFNPYEIGPYAMGEACVTLPYGEFAELLLPEYQMGEGEGVSVLPEGAKAELVLGRDNGEKATVQIYEAPQADGEYDYGYRSYLLEVGTQTEQAAELNWLKNVYVLRREDGRTFLIFDGDVASDDFVTYVYELTDGQIQRVYESPACTEIREGTVTLQGMQLGIRVDMLGTYTAYGEYCLTEDGELEQDGEWYTINNPYGGGVLTSIREVPAVSDGKEIVLPAGSKLLIVGTDMQGILRYQLVDSGEEGEICFERGTNGWPIYIDGVSELEYFEDLPYAG